MSSAREIQAEISALRGYASDTEFNEAYGDEGFKTVRTVAIPLSAACHRQRGPSCSIAAMCG